MHRQCETREAFACGELGAFWYSDGMLLKPAEPDPLGDAVSGFCRRTRDRDCISLSDGPVPYVELLDIIAQCAADPVIRSEARRLRRLVLREARRNRIPDALHRIECEIRLAYWGDL